MKLVQQSATLMSPDSLHEARKIIKRVEQAARVCYKSEDRTTDESAARIIKICIINGHESVLEHATATFRIICDRGVSHEIVRHRIASYSQESTRYVSYKGKDIAFISPFLDTLEPRSWIDAIVTCENEYHAMIRNGHAPQVARSVLPNALKTELVMTANMRSWRNFMRLRCADLAHPMMQQVANQIKTQLAEIWPEMMVGLDE
jgi:thymidylate synthase (FAD)